MKFFITFFLLLSSISLFSQVKIGENPGLINSNSILELKSSEKVFVLTRVNATQMNLISPLEGALVYNTDSQCIFQYNGIIWESLCNNGSGNQMLSFDSTTNIITLEDGGFVDLSNFLSTDYQNLTLSGNILTLENGGTVDLIPYLDNTDNQQITDFSITGAILTITLEDGGTQNVDLSSFEESSKITANTTLINTNATDIADHIANDLDTDPTNELQDISLNGTELVLSNPATSGNLVDLTGQITLPMFADGTNTNDEIYWDGTQWVYGTRVASVNLSTPDTDGNINIPIGNVFTGPTTNTGDIGTIEIGGTPQEGDIYVVNSDAADPAQVGTTYILRCRYYGLD